MNRLSKECRDLLTAAPARAPRRTLSIAENRKSLENIVALFGEPDPTVRRTEHWLDGVGVIRYTPPNSSARGVCIYAHGGGWVLGSTATHNTYCSRLAGISGCTVVSVDYRQPPEHPFPAAIDDVLTVIKAVHQGHIPDVDRSRIAVAGDSAGGNLAAAAAWRLRDESGNQAPIRLVVLVLPVLDNRPELYPSYRDFADGFSLTADDMTWYFEHYAGPDWQTRSEPDLVPMRSPDLVGFPTTLVLTAECDVLRDEGEAFARRLVEAGTVVTQARVPGTFHPYFLFADILAAARDSLEFVGTSLGREIGGA